MEKYLRHRILGHFAEISVCVVYFNFGIDFFIAYIGQCFGIVFKLICGDLM